MLSTLASHGDYNAVRFCLEGFRAWMTNDRLMKRKKFESVPVLVLHSDLMQLSML